MHQTLNDVNVHLVQLHASQLQMHKITKSGIDSKIDTVHFPDKTTTQKVHQNSIKIHFALARISGLTGFLSSSMATNCQGIFDALVKSDNN